MLLIIWLLTFYATSLADQQPSAIEDVHRALITEAAVLPPELLRRDIATCAYISGDPGQ